MKSYRAGDVRKIGLRKRRGGDEYREGGYREKRRKKKSIRKRTKRS